MSKKMFQSSLEEANDKQEDRIENQSAFIHIIDHEFRTTLTGIQGFSELLCEEELTPEEVKTFARDILSEAVRLSTVITRFLDLECMKSNKSTLKWGFVNVNEILRTVAKQTEPLTSSHMLRLDLDETLPHIQGDQSRLAQVVDSLVTNALTYSPSGGEILLKSEREDTFIEMSIYDQGIGIPSHVLEVIFDAFSHRYVDKTRYIPGTGLGLPIVKQIVQLHGGRVWVESTVGKGSGFHVLLPTSDENLLVDHRAV